MVGAGSETCLEEEALGDRGIRHVPVDSYLLGLPEESPGTAVVDVDLAQALKRSSHGDVWGGKTGQGHQAFRAPWLFHSLLSATEPSVAVTSAWQKCSEQQGTSSRPSSGGNGGWGKGKKFPPRQTAGQ